MLQDELESSFKARKIIFYDQTMNQGARSSKSAYKLQVAAKTVNLTGQVAAVSILTISHTTKLQ